MRKLKKVATGGTVSTVVALVCRLVFAQCFGASHVEAWGQYIAYGTLAFCIVIGLILMSPELVNPIRLVGNSFFGTGFGGLVMTKFAEISANFNLPQTTILLCEVIAFFVLFVFSGVMYSRTPWKTRNA